jgi:hypothetical protein
MNIMVQQKIAFVESRIMGSVKFNEVGVIMDHSISREFWVFINRNINGIISIRRVQIMYLIILGVELRGMTNKHL